MSRFWSVIGTLWALPITLIGLLCVVPLSLLCWCEYAGRHGAALIWTIDRSVAPQWFCKSTYCGWTFGNVVLSASDISSPIGQVMLRHEQEHVHQQMTLGVLYPLLRGLASLGLRCCRAAHHTYDNPFEVDARRAAGQVIDVVGAVRRAIDAGKIRPSHK